MFQSTHPHGVRLVRQIVIMTYESVSIHAPTRGATLHGSVLRRGIRVSIHAPTRGATMLINPTSEFDRVSIHAPTRGATGRRDTVTGAILFQSTHPHGVRPS